MENNIENRLASLEKMVSNILEIISMQDRANAQWLPEELKQVRNKYTSGDSIETIAADLGRSTSAVYAAINRMNLKRKKSQILSSDAEKYIDANYLSEKYVDIAKHLGVLTQDITRYVSKQIHRGILKSKNNKRK